MVVGAFDRIGIKAVPKWRWATLDLASHTRELLQLLKVDCVLDVGANKGQYANFLRAHVGYEGEILSFEPVPELALALSERAKRDPLWHVFHCALGAREEFLSINITQGTTLHSFRTPAQSGVEWLDHINTVIRTEKVPVRTVDSILKERDSSNSNIFFQELQGLQESRHFLVDGDAGDFHLEGCNMEKGVRGSRQDFMIVSLCVQFQKKYVRVT